MNAARPIGERVLTPRQLELLGQLEFNGRWATFTGGQISDWKNLKEPLEALGGIWSSKRKGFWWRDGFDPLALVSDAIESGTILDPRAAEFFATPGPLAARLVKLTDIRPGHRVLEPSAGTGNLVRAVLEACPKVTVFAVEALSSFAVVIAELAREKYGGRLEHVHDDFLKVHHGLTGLFDRVVMNPPFSGGQDVEHVTRALRFLKPDGLLVAVMSAGVEFRDDRRTREFRGLLDELRGTIERNPEGSFKASGTDVRTVTVRIPMPQYVAPEPSSDEDEEPFGAAAYVDDPPPVPPPDEPSRKIPPGESLAVRHSIEELVRRYERCERDIRQGFKLIENAEHELSDVFAPTTGTPAHDKLDRDNRPVDDRLRELRRGIWWQLIERLELRRMMSLKAWDDLNKKLKDPREVPPITIETVTAMAQGFRDRLPQMLEEAVSEVYNWLIPRHEDTLSAQYKTNKLHGVGKRVVLTWMVDPSWSDWQLRSSNHGPGASEHLTALENVFSALDGKGQVTKTHWSQIETKIREIPRSKPCVGETPYFRFRGFRNGNLHLQILREDLLLKFNKIAGGRRMRPKSKEAAE